MRKLDKPAISAKQVYSDCVSTIKNSALKTKLSACESLILQAEDEFNKKITKGKIYTIAQETIINTNVTIAELKKIYTNQMIGKELGRKYYDQLVTSAPLGLCPLCSHRDVTTLDHYLPKSKYPRLSVVPINLIPSCKDCNTGKLSDFPSTAEQETLHPYFDDIENVLWLKAIVNKTSPISINFFVEKAPIWDDLLFRRVEYHFKSFKLKQLYAVQAARKLSTMRKNLFEIFDNGGGSSAIKKYLTAETDSIAAINLNSWEAVLLRGLKDDDWFCSQGFRQI